MGGPVVVSLTAPHVGRRGWGLGVEVAVDGGSGDAELGGDLGDGVEVTASLVCFVVDLPGGPGLACAELWFLAAGTAAGPGAVSPSRVRSDIRACSFGDRAEDLEGHPAYRAAHTELPPDYPQAEIGLLPGDTDEYIITSGGLKGQRGSFTRNDTGAVVGVDPRRPSVRPEYSDNRLSPCSVPRGGPSSGGPSGSWWIYCAVTCVSRSRTVRGSRPRSVPSSGSTPAKKPLSAAWYMPSMKRAMTSFCPAATWAASHCS